MARGVLGVKSVELMVRNHVPPELLRKADWGEYGWGLGTSVRMSLLSGGPGSVGAFGWNGGTGTLYLVDPIEKTRRRSVHPIAAWHSRGIASAR